MLLYILKRVFYVVPVALGVSLLCFLLVHIAPGDPLVSVLPADASQALVEEMRKAYGFDRPLPVQFAIWLGPLRVVRTNEHLRPKFARCTIG